MGKLEKAKALFSEAMKQLENFQLKEVVRIANEGIECDSGFIKNFVLSKYVNFVLNDFNDETKNDFYSFTKEVFQDHSKVENSAFDILMSDFIVTYFDISGIVCKEISDYMQKDNSVTKLLMKTFYFDIDFRIYFVNCILDTREGRLNENEINAIKTIITDEKMEFCNTLKIANFNDLAEELTNKYSKLSERINKI